MNAVERRSEIVSILIVRRSVTARELAGEFGVTMRTIQNDVQTLSTCYPIYTKQGGGGGIFIREGYNPYMNTLTEIELKVLIELRDMMDGLHREILSRVICKYGPCGLES